MRAVTGAVNQAKGAADPSNWIPPHEPFVCTYVADWIAIKARWGLSMDQSEHGRLRNLINDRCGGLTIAAWDEPTTEPTEAPSGDCDPSYPTVCIPSPPPDLDCGDIEQRGFVVNPPDPHRFDLDRDGIGCAS